MVARRPVDPALPQLTQRQLEVLAAVALTGSRKEGAARLGISMKVLVAHLSLAYDALGVERQAEAHMALGWLEIPEQYR